MALTSNEYHDDKTLFRVLTALKKSGLSGDQGIKSIIEMQNAGILFREYEERPIMDDTAYVKFVNVKKIQSRIARFSDEPE